MVAMALFLTAGGANWLIVARIVRGLATGAAISPVGAALVDLDPVRGSMTNSISPPAHWCNMRRAGLLILIASRILAPEDGA